MRPQPLPVPPLPYPPPLSSFVDVVVVLVVELDVVVELVVVVGLVVVAQRLPTPMLIPARTIAATVATTTSRPRRPVNVNAIASKAAIAPIPPAR